MRRKRRLIIGLLLTPVPLLCVCLVSGLAILNYDKFGRISDFTPVSDGLTVTGTSYVFTFAPLADGSNTTEISLRNSQTHSETFVSAMLYPYPPAYRLLRHNVKSYLLLSIYRKKGGSASGYIFDVFDITNDPPHSILGDIKDDFSCTYPRLDGDSLEFERAEKCDYIAWPFVAVGKPTTYMVPLK